jgi:hypothetical protein
MEFLISSPRERKQRRTAKWFDGAHCLVIPTGIDASVVYLLGSDGRPALESLQRIAFSSVEGVVTSPSGQPLFRKHVVHLESRSQVSRPQTARVAHFDGKLTLLGYDLNTSNPQSLSLTLHWQAKEQILESYTVFVHLVGTSFNPSTGNRIWGQRDSLPCNGSYRTTTWATDEVVIDHYHVAVPANAPPGEYEIVVGMYELSTLKRAQITGRSGEALGDQLSLGRVSR